MPFDVNIWLNELKLNLKDSFGERLLFLGLQGSHRRGEATDTSDIDVVIVLDKLSAEDLQLYREMIHMMPDYEKACGFICGKSELKAWPKYDLFTLYFDTMPIHGNLDSLIAKPLRQDAAEAVSIGAANLYHAACHSYLYDSDKAQSLSDLYKGTLFLLLGRHYQNTGEYLPSSLELRPTLNGEDLEIFTSCQQRRAFLAAGSAELEEGYRMLIRWCSRLLREPIK